MEIAKTFYRSGQLGIIEYLAWEVHISYRQRSRFDRQIKRIEIPMKAGAQINSFTGEEEDMLTLSKFILHRYHTIMGS